MRLGPKIALIFAVPIAGCSLFVSLDGLSGGTSSDAGGSDAATNDAPSDGAKNDGSTNVDAGPTCPDGGGPSMVNVGSFCIDSTETTNTQYEEFLAASPSLSSLPAECSFKTRFTSPSSVSDGPNVAVRGIDWCDAYGYCEWAGKRLCGSVDGGPSPYDQFALVQSQWYFACSGGGLHAYPYGDTYEPAVCNDQAYDAGTAVDVKQASKCVGGFPGLYDMAGNVWEWEDSCETDGGPRALDQCRCRGGTFVDGANVTSCGFDSLDHFSTLREDESGFVGVRCCSR